MFKFNFNISSDEKDVNPSSVAEKTNDKKESLVECYDCELIEIDQGKLNNLDLYKSNCTKYIKNDFKISYISPDNLNTILETYTNDIIKADINHSDLMPGIYEGGAKVWECTEDLIEYLLENFDSEYLKNKKILDLGCGVGLLGIFALKQGADKVCFQDYNKDVLENVTIPSVLLNIEEDLNFEKLNSKCKFYSGDWMKFIEFTKCKEELKDKEEKYDFIFTSETIYNPENYKKLLDTFDNKLENNTGIIFLAAKTYYFGVGGGLRQFEELINIDKRFISKIIWNSTNGVFREILEIQRNKNTESGEKIR